MTLEVERPALGRRSTLLASHALVVWVVLGLLVARILGIISVYFFEEDEVSLAVGAAALVADTPGQLYRYTVQLGYYRLIEWLDILAGSRIGLIPVIMKALSAVAGAVLPALGLLAFKRELTLRERWLAVLVLAINPIVWRGSQYGNTAMLATTLATVSLVVLSNRPGALVTAAALACFGMATLIRADTILLTPVLLLLLYRLSGSLSSALKRAAVFGLVMAAVYAIALTVDPRIDSAGGSVAGHMTIDRPTMFWEYLLWAVSPIALVFALWGIRSLLDSRPQLLVCLLLWLVPTLLFYFRATTTARYFMNAVVPLSIAGAVAMAELADRLTRHVRPLAAWSVTLGLACLHLFLALGHVPANRPLELLFNGTFQTDDGPMQTGALLARTYLGSGSLLRSLPRPRFGDSSYPFWEGASFNKAVGILADPAAPSRTVIVILAGGYGHAFHYHTHLAGARFISTPPKPTLLWQGETWLQLGNSRVMTVGVWSGDYDAVKRFDVKAGDQIWALSEKRFSAELTAKLPPEIALAPIPPFDEHFQTFAVIDR